MSLLSYSSPWTNDVSDRNENGVSRKKTPTLGGVRKTVKVRPNYDSATDNYATVDLDNQDANSRGNKMPESFEDHIEKQTERNTKINSILNKITSFDTSDKLGDFNPMPYPTIITKRNTDNVIAGEERVNNGENPLMPKTAPVLCGSQQKPSNKPSSYFRASEPGENHYSSYRDAYGKEGLTNISKEPYYAKMGIGRGDGDKVMDRLNYMTQMLESLQMEKTNHATEEFVLYCLLGVFMIYIVDGFSRGGKYVR
jgi:hypothetical protein